MRVLDRDQRRRLADAVDIPSIYRSAAVFGTKLASSDFAGKPKSWTG